MLSEILSRIESRLKAVNLSAATASGMAGLSKDAIRNIQRAVESGKDDAGTSTTTIVKLAPILQTSASWLLEGEGDESVARDQTVRRVTVSAHIQAGVWTESWEWPESDQYQVFIPNDPVFIGFKLHAAEARGPSMNKRYPEGTVLVFTDVNETMEDPVPGKRYIVERKRPSGETEHTVKLLHLDDEGRYWLVPESTDPRFQAPIAVDEGTGDGDTVSIIGRVCYSVSRE